MANSPHLRWTFAACKAITIASFGIAACAFVGHLLDKPVLYRWGSTGVMAWPTSTYAMLLSVVVFILSSGMRAFEKQTRQSQAKPTRKKLARS